MKVCVLFLLSVILAALVVDEVISVCCGNSNTFGSFHGRCQDCTWGTPYCGKYECNMFGCACVGGCREGNCRWKRSTNELPESPSEIFSQIDVNGDSMIDKTEFYQSAKAVGRPAYETEGLSEEAYLVQEFVKMDKNGDGMISPAEFDADLK